MANRYSAAIASAAAPASGAAFCEFRNAATQRVAITEIGVFLGAATASGVGLIRATTQGTGGAATALGQAEDPADVAATASLAVNAFTLAPALGTVYLRRARLPATIGTGIIWTWPETNPLLVAVSASLAIVNIHSAAGSAATDIYVSWLE